MVGGQTNLRGYLAPHKKLPYNLSAALTLSALSPSTMSWNSAGGPQQYSLGEIIRGGALVRGLEKSWPSSSSKGK